jgi:hypothetical protein
MDSGSQDHSVAVHVCADDSGKLLQDPTILRSSGIAGFDEADFRPGANSDRKPVSGCAQWVIEFDPATSPATVPFH